MQKVTEQSNKQDILTPFVATEFPDLTTGGSATYRIHYKTDFNIFILEQQIKWEFITGFDTCQNILSAGM